MMSPMGNRDMTRSNDARLMLAAADAFMNIVMSLLGAQEASRTACEHIHFHIQIFRLVRGFRVRADMRISPALSNIVIRNIMCC